MYVKVTSLFPLEYYEGESISNRPNFTTADVVPCGGRKTKGYIIVVQIIFARPLGSLTSYLVI